ncbi:MAG: spermidine synthase [Deltaproteobacteria bacterium]|nr:MAG: spermidine synthase [Deltaproteobacteria bacterium]
MRPWKTLDTADTEDGRLELLRRGGEDFLITIDGRVLMSSMLHKSEVELSTWGCGPVRNRSTPRVLTAGLGLGFTLRAALDILPASAQVVVAELNPVVVKWCRGPAAILSDDALSDERVELVVGDVMDCVRDVGRGVRAPFDAIVIDLYVGPGPDPGGEYEAVYGDAALAAVRAALTDGGVYAVWGEAQQPEFYESLQRAGFETSCARPRGPGRRHVIYVGIKPS